MRPRMRLFERLHDLAGAAETQRDVPAAATAGHVWQVLAAEFPTVALYARSVSVAVSADFRR